MSMQQRLTPETELALIQAAKAHDEYAQEQLILAHMPLIRILARRFCTSMSFLDELTQAGAVGLIRALRRYDENNHVKLITYAVPWIIGEMRTAVRALEQHKTCSLHEESGKEGISLEETLGCEGIDLSHLDLRMALAQLERDERLLIYLRFFRDKTQKETAALLGKSQSQVSKLEQRTLDRLRSLLC